MNEFNKIGIHNHLIESLQSLSIYKPTLIQKEAIPFILNGKDIIAQAQTGTGKTLAFVLPIVQKIDVSKDYVQALIVAPTRELAIQLTEEINKVTKSIENLHVLAIYGGQDVEQQLKKLNKVNQLIVATPGRLLDHVRRGTIDLSKTEMLVLDEADQMLHMGFLPEVETILFTLPKQKQMMLFSATMPPAIRALSKKYMNNPEEVTIKYQNITVEKINQLVIETTDRGKLDSLCQLINEYRPFLAILFCRTKRRAKSLNAALQSRGYLSDELHGDLSQAKRERVIKKFRDAKIQLLVATDVAARGLDIEGITHVFNYDIPHDVESYIHRIGRTGRAGFEGIAITLVAKKDMQHLQLIENGIQRSLPKKSHIKHNGKGSEKEDLKSNKKNQLHRRNHNKKYDKRR